MGKVKKVGSLLRYVAWLIMKCVTMMLAMINFIIPQVAKAATTITGWLQRSSSEEAT